MPEDVLYNTTELLNDMAMGNAEAFSRIYRLLYRNINYFAFTLTSDRAQAEDIATEAFVQLWNKRTEFVSLAGVKSYLYLAARHGAIDFLRAAKRHDASHRELRYLAPEADQFIGYEISDAEILSELYRQVQALPPQCAEVFRLLYFEGRTTAEAAAMLRITTKTVLNQKGKAIKLLKTALLKKGLLSLFLIIDALR